MDFKVTLIQTDIKIGNEKENFKKTKDFLHKAAEQGTDVAVLPETWLTGFGKKIFENIDHYAEKEHGEKIHYLEEFAVDNDMHLVAGTILEKERDKKVYNNLYFIDNKGNIGTKYSKMHLYSPGGEHEVVTPGKSISTYQTEFGKFGFITCYDIRFPELIRLYALEEIDVLYVTANFNDPKRNQWLNQLKARALENQIYVIACNRSGDKYFGNSVIISPEGEVTLNAGRREGIYSGFVDLSLIKAVRKELPLFVDRRDDVYELKLKRGEA
jgi:predicted amidohydrolase